MANLAQVDFRYGMVSEKLRRRTDLSIYQNSASLIENAVPLRTGGVRQREGLKCIGDSTVSATRIVPLSVSAERSFVVAFEPYVEGMASDVMNGKVLDVKDGSLKGDFHHDFTASILSEMSFAQNYEMMVFAHKAHRPAMLKIVVEENGDMSFPFREFVPKTNRTVYVDGAIDEDASTGIEEYNYKDFINQGNYPAGVAFVANRLVFYNFLKTPYGLFMSKPFEYTDFQESVLYRTSVSGISKGLYLKALELQGTVVSEKGTHTGKDGTTTYENSMMKEETTVSTAGYYITTVTIVDFETGAVLESFVKTRKYRFSENNGVWEKEILPDYDYSAVYYATDTYKYSEVITDECAIRLELASDRDETICWLGQNGEYIFAGTTSSEWIMPSGMTATAVQCSKLSSYGSKTKTHCAFGMRNIFHVQAGGRKIRSIQYSAQGTGFSELSYPIPELFADGVSSIVWQRVPEPRLYALCGTDRKKLAVMCYDADYGVSAWCSWTFASDITSMCVVDTEDGQKLVAIYGGHLCELDESTYKDGTETAPFIPKVATNNIDSSSTMANGKRNYSIMADTDGTPFSACSYSPATNKVTPFVCRRVNAQLSKVEAYTPYPCDQGLRVLIQGKGGEPFTLLALITDMEVGQ